MTQQQENPAVWLYRKSGGRGLDDMWTVGFFHPDGKWEAESDHLNADAAADRVRWLNGGAAAEPAKAFGGWRVEEKDGRVLVLDELGHTVADCGLASSRVAHSNAGRIAAAPEMYAALKTIVDGAEKSPASVEQIYAAYDAARAAIAKAEARS